MTLDAVCRTTVPTKLSTYFSQQLRWRRSNIIDYAGGMSHVWRLNPIVAIHFFSLFGLILLYPILVVRTIFAGRFFPALVVHLVFAAAFGVWYRWRTRRMPKDDRVASWSFLPIAIVLPVIYALMTPVAAFTLDSSSWETRGHDPEPVTTGADAEPIPHRGHRGRRARRPGRPPRARRSRAPSCPPPDFPSPPDPRRRVEQMHMETTVKTPFPSRFRHLIQPTIVKLYRIVGMVALGAILVGLIVFLAVNIFYFFNRTWVRPVILSPEHTKVVAATTALNDATSQESEMATERADAKADLDKLGREIVQATKAEAELAPLVPATPKTVAQAQLKLQLDHLELERQDATERQDVLRLKIKDLDGRLASQKKLVARLAASPYIRATTEKKVVAFVPYQNLSNVRPGVKLFGCDWGLIKCHAVGKVLSVLDGEVQDVHPHDDSVQRGVMVEIQLTDPEAAEQNVLFAGSKPFWWL